jgi:hypothetical protein
MGGDKNRPSSGGQAIVALQDSFRLSETPSRPVAIKVQDLPSSEASILKPALESFPEGTVFRIINDHLVATAMEYGTDKGRVGERDFRQIGDGSGYDVWGVESNLDQLGLTKADVFCGTPKSFFLSSEAENYKTESLGLPTDRSAILAFNGSLLAEIPETDGYRFLDPANKKEALLGVLRFPKTLLPFEVEMQQSPDPIAVLEREVRVSLQRRADVERLQRHIALNITNTLYDAPEGASSQRLQALGLELKERVFLIENWENLQSHLEALDQAKASGNPKKIARAERYPAFVVKEARKFLSEHPQLQPEFRRRYEQLISDASALMSQNPSGFLLNL